MSINKIYTKTNRITAQKYNFFLTEFRGALEAEFTLEEKVFIEGQLIDYIEKIDDLSFNSLTEFDLFLEKDIVTTENLIKYSLRVSEIQSFELQNIFISYFNQSILSIESIVGKLNRIKQKLAALDVWNNEFIKFVVSEKFINFDNIGFNIVKGKKCEIDTVQGVLTLPLKSEEEVAVRSVTISKGNGNSGNSDIEVDASTNSVAALFDRDLNTWYEYERLDNGPVTLALSIELTADEIINCVEIIPFSGDSYFTVKDIRYSGNSRDYKSVKDLTIVENDSYYTPKEFSNGQKWSINFTPIKTNTVTIVLSNNNSEYINVRGVNKVSKRKRFAIGIREIIFKKKKYSNEGSFNSTNIKLIENCYVGDADIKVIPNNKTLYDVELDISTDGGETWNRDSLDSSFLVEDSKELLYKMNLIRNDNAFSTSTTFENEEDNSYLKIKTKPASKKISPNTININEPIAGNEIFVFQDTFIRKTSSTTDLKWLSKIKRLNARIFNQNAPTGDFLFLPFKHNLSDYEIYNEEIEVYVNNEKWEEVNLMSDLLAIQNTYYIKDDLKTIVFNRNHLEYGSKIKWKVKPEELFFFRREKGYYARFSNLFNPSKGAINLEFTRGKEATYIERIPKNRRTVKLERKGILKSSIKFLTNNSAITFTQVTSKDQVQTNGNNVYYYFNEENSLIYFAGNLNFREIIKVSYNATDYEKSENSNYEIWFEDSIPKGIWLKNENFAAEDVEEKLSVSSPYLKLKYDVKEKKERIRDDLFFGNSQVFTLSNKNIVAGTVRLNPEVFGESSSSLDMSPTEVPFIDGRSEFLNLKTIQKEKTNRILSDSQGFVTFKLAAGAAFYKEMPIEFVTSDYNFVKVTNFSNTPYEFTVSENGEVKVFVGVSEFLPENIDITYSYIENTMQNLYKYSVDYYNGVLYLSEPIYTGRDKVPKVFYKTSNYIASYDIVNQIKNFTFNKNSKRVEVDAEYLSEENKSLGIAYLVKDIKVSLVELKEYFTPFIDRIDFRFK